MNDLLLLCDFSSLEDRIPSYVLARHTDLVIIRYDENVSVLYGRCHHRGALLSDGYVDGNNLICGVHFWDYRYDTGISEYNNDEALYKFESIIKDEKIWIRLDELEKFEKENPVAIPHDEYLGPYIATHPAPEEPKTAEIHKLAKYGLTKDGPHGPIVSMGVSSEELPSWDQIQILPAQLASFPLSEDEHVETEVTIGKYSKKPLILKHPLFVSDMSFGSLSEEAKTALARGAEKAGTAICSGEGGMLPEEKAECRRYLYEYATGEFGFSWELIKEIQAFHFKLGQGAKTGTGGHLPGYKNKGKISQVRNIPEGEPAISPPRFRNFNSISDFKTFAEKVRHISGGVPIGIKMSANHIEKDIDAAIEIGVDYIILDGRGGGTGAAPAIFRDHISVPTIPALARARSHLDKRDANSITLIITGGLRTVPDFIKALALGADAIALANSAMQAIGCQAMRACHTNNCPVGIATQKPHLRSRLDIELSAQRLERFFSASTQLMCVMARACGHTHLNQFNIHDVTTFNRELAYQTGMKYGGVTPITL